MLNYLNKSQIFTYNSNISRNHCKKIKMKKMENLLNKIKKIKKNKMIRMGIKQILKID